MTFLQKTKPSKSGKRMLHNHLRRVNPEFKWEIANPCGDISHLSHYDTEGICEVMQPMVSINMVDSQWKLDESTYKELGQLIDPQFLQQKVRADVLNGLNFSKWTNLVSTQTFPEKNIMEFLINSSEFEKNRIRYVMSAMFDQWEEIGQDMDLNFQERALMLLWTGNLRLHCTCPSFLWWGYQYLMTTMDSAVIPVVITPDVRNPSQRGIVCKHLNRLLRVLPFYSGDISSEMKRQFG